MASLRPAVQDASPLLRRLRPGESFASAVESGSFVSSGMALVEFAHAAPSGRRLQCARPIDRRWDRSRGIVFSKARRCAARDFRWSPDDHIVFADVPGSTRSYATRTLGSSKLVDIENPHWASLIDARPVEQAKERLEKERKAHQQTRRGVQGSHLRLRQAQDQTTALQNERNQSKAREEAFEREWEHLRTALAEARNEAREDVRRTLRDEAEHVGERFVESEEQQAGLNSVIEKARVLAKEAADEDVMAKTEGLEGRRASLQSSKDVAWAQVERTFTDRLDKEKDDLRQRALAGTERPEEATEAAQKHERTVIRREELAEKTLDAALLQNAEKFENSKVALQKTYEGHSAIEAHRVGKANVDNREAERLDYASYRKVWTNVLSSAKDAKLDVSGLADRISQKTSRWEKTAGKYKGETAHLDKEKLLAERLQRMIGSGATGDAIPFRRSSPSVVSWKAHGDAIGSFEFRPIGRTTPSRPDVRARRTARKAPVRISSTAEHSSSSTQASSPSAGLNLKPTASLLQSAASERGEVASADQGQEHTRLCFLDALQCSMSDGRQSQLDAPTEQLDDRVVVSGTWDESTVLFNGLESSKMLAYGSPVDEQPEHASCARSDPDFQLESPEAAAPSRENGVSENNESLEQPIADVEMSYQMSSEDYRNAATSSRNSNVAYWTYRFYKNAEGKTPVLYYCTTFEQTETRAKEFLDESVVGFDIEWEIDAYLGKQSIKRNVSLIQIASEDKIGLFHVSLFKGEAIDELMPPSLRTLLQSTSIAKVGVNVQGDAQRLSKHLEVEMKGLFELSHLYKVVKFGATDATKVNKKPVSLAEQVQQVLLLPLKKDEVRTSAWSRKLNMSQTEYAASDAYAGFRLYHALDARRKKMDPTPPRPAFYEEHQPIELGNGTKIVPKIYVRKKRTSEVGKAAAADEDESDEYFDALETLDTDSPDPPGSTNVAGVLLSGLSVARPPSPPSDELSQMVDDVRLGETSSTARPKRGSTPVVHPQVELSNQWVRQYQSSRPTGLGNRKVSPPATLRAYHLWHTQGFDCPQIAALVRDPPVKPDTIAVYIFRAVRDESLPFNAERLEEVLRVMPRAIYAKYQRVWEMMQQ